MTESKATPVKQDEMLARSRTEGAERQYPHPFTGLLALLVLVLALALAQKQKAVSVPGSSFG
jgi:hypothetical protein